MKIVIDQHYNRKKLQALLEYEIGGSAIFFLHYLAGPVLFFIPPILHRVISVVIIAGLCTFVWLIFKVLIREKRYIWMILFFAMVLLPGVVTYIYLLQAGWMHNMGKGLIGAQVSVAGLFVYSCMLRLTIPTWYFHDEN